MMERLLSGRRLLPPLLLLIPLFVLFWPIVGGGEMLFWGAGDIAFGQYPPAHFLAQALKQGDLPLWNPHLQGGYPFVANWISEVFTPFTLLYLLLPAPAAYSWGAILGLFIAGISMYALLRVHTMPVPAALVGAAAFMLNGQLVVRLATPVIAHSYVWFPALFLFLELAVRRQRLAFASLAAPFLALAWLTYPNAAVYASYAAAFFYLFHAAAAWRHGARRAALFLLRALPVTLGLAALLAAVQLLPTWELLRFSQTPQGHVFNVASEHALPLHQLVVLLLPNFFGSEAAGLYWGWWTWGELTVYLGIAPLLLAAVVPFLRVGPRSLFYLSLALVALLLSLGSYGPLYALFYRLPLAFYLREPARILPIFAFAVAWCAARALATAWLDGPLLQRVSRRAVPFLLAASAGAGILALAAGAAPHLIVGAARWLEGPLGRVHWSYFADLFLRTGAGDLPRLALALLALGLAFLLYSRRVLRPSLLCGSLFVVISLDLLSFGNGLNPTVPPERYLAPPEVLPLLEIDREPYRMVSVFTAGNDPRSTDIVDRWRDHYPAWFPPKAGDLPLRAELLSPGLNLLHGITSAQGNQGLLLQRPDELVKAAYDPSLPFSPERLDLPLLGRLNVRYLLSPAPISATGLELVHAGRVWLYRNLAEQPRAYVAEQVMTVPAGTPLREALALWQRNPHATLVETRIAQGSAGRAAITRYDNDEIEIATTLERDGLLVLADTWYPGWQASVNGTSVEIWRVNHAQRAVALPAGTHEVRFWYAPESLALGAAASAAGLIVVAAAAVAALRRRQASPLLVLGPRP